MMKESPTVCEIGLELQFRSCKRAENNFNTSIHTQYVQYSNISVLLINYIKYK